MINAKKRPMLVLAEKGEGIIGCAITSNPDSEGVDVEFQDGSLPLRSKIKYWQIHTFLKGMATGKVAKISKRTHNELLKKINDLFQPS
ncbi:type II toxin-antitoxin system PemK/MazF family toxin [Candidatus Woesearchaeota archaeon]|nr:type II toxin-antitoxin system PemK/MazF family toxin [Candidatus Woesearchaeota archaeon]